MRGVSPRTREAACGGTAQKATRLIDDGFLGGEVEKDETFIGVDERNKRRD